MAFSVSGGDGGDGVGGCYNYECVGATLTITMT